MKTHIRKHNIACSITNRGKTIGYYAVDRWHRQRFLYAIAFPSVAARKRWQTSERKPL